MCYQPLIEGKNFKLLGAEALLRWQSPEYGMVPPMRFIPIIENDPAFVVLGEWVLRTAMEGALPLLERHPGFMLNVNLSYQQIQQTSFVGMVKQLLEDNSLRVQDIAGRIGFNYAQSFITFFKAATNLTPGEYRHKHAR